MNKPADVNVLVYAATLGIAQTLRMALRGAGVRTVHLASNINQVLEGFSLAEPHVAVIYIDGAEQADPGLSMLAFIRRHEQSPNRRIPVVVVSQRREMATIQAAGDAGAHEYVLFPVSGEVLLKKVHAARTSTRPFIETDAYVGPDRRPTAG